MNLITLDQVRVDRQSWPFGNVVKIASKDSSIDGFLIDSWFEFTDESGFAEELQRVENIEARYYDSNGILLRDGERPFGKLNYLPTEFFSHQLLDVVANDVESVFSFVRDWGLPYSPLRYNRSCMCPEGFSVDDALSAIDLTNDLGLDFSCTYAERLISVAEAVSTLDLMQRIVRQLHTVIRVEMDNVGTEGGFYSEEGFCSDPINAVSCNSFAIASFPSSVSHAKGYVPLGMLTSAIANQMIEVLNDPSEWKICACEGCGRPFKHKQTERRNPDSKSQYCCQRCAERQRKRNQRKAKPAR